MSVLIKAMPRIPSYEIALFRSLITFSITLVLLLRKRIFPFGRKQHFMLLLRGVAGSFALLLYFYSLQHLPLATAVTLQYLSPAFTILFATFMVGEKIHWKQWLFFAISFSGVTGIEGFGTSVSWKLMLIGISAAAFSGIAYNAIRKVRNDASALVIVLYLPMSTIPLLTPYCAGHWVMPHRDEWLSLIGVGLLTQFAQLTMTWAYQMEKAGNIANYGYLGIVFALCFGYLLFGEKVSYPELLGMMLVVAGILLNFLYIHRVTSPRRFIAYMRNFPGF